MSAYDGWNVLFWADHHLRVWPSEMFFLLNFAFQICLHPRCFYSHNRVHISNSHTCCDTSQIYQSDFLHCLLQEPLYPLALGWDISGLCWNPHVCWSLENLEAAHVQKEKGAVIFSGAMSRSKEVTEDPQWQQRMGGLQVFFENTFFLGKSAFIQNNKFNCFFLVRTLFISPPSHFWTLDQVSL